VIANLEKNFKFSVENIEKMLDSLELDEKKVNDIKFSKLIDLLKSGKSFSKNKFS